MADSQIITELNIDIVSRKRGGYLCLGIMFLMLIMYIIAGTAVPKATYIVPGIIDCTYPSQSHDGACKYLKTSLNTTAIIQDPTDPNSLREFQNLVWNGYIENVSNWNYAIDIDMKPHTWSNEANPESWSSSHNWEIEIEFTLDISVQKKDGTTELVATKLVDIQKLICRAGRNGEKHWCDWMNIFHETELLEGNYIITLTFNDIGKYWGKLIDELRFDTTMYNPKYITFQMITRYTFFCLSLIGMVLFWVNQNRQVAVNRIYEQNFVWWLSIQLPFCNDPLAFVNIVYPNMVTLFIVVVCIGVFVVHLNIFWAVMLRRIKDDNNSVNYSTNIWIKIYIWLMFIIQVLGSMILNYNYAKDPGYSIGTSQPDLYKLAIVVLIILYMCWAVYLLSSICGVAKVWKTRQARHKAFVTFSFYFMISIIIFVATGWSNYHSKNGTGQLLSITVYNVYIWGLQYLYCFSNTGKFQNAAYQNNEINYQNNANFNYMDNIQDDEHETDDDDPNVFRMDKGNDEDFQNNVDNHNDAQIQDPEKINTVFKNNDNGKQGIYKQDTNGNRNTPQNLDMNIGNLSNPKKEGGEFEWAEQNYENEYMQQANVRNLENDEEEEEKR